MEFRGTGLERGRGFEGNLFLVTGASAGIGRAVALDLARAGARVLVCGRNVARLEETVAMLPGEGHIAVPGKLGDLDSTSAWVGALVKIHGPIRGIVHSAGINSGQPLRMLKQSHLAEVMQINVEAAFGLLKGFRQRNAHAPGAAVVLISSVMGLVGAPGKSVYCASKGALISLCQASALELAREDIRVNCVAPGYVATDMLEELRTQLTDEQFNAIQVQHPLGFGTPGDIAQAVLFLLADQARWITGATLAVDGGYSAQ